MIKKTYFILYVSGQALSADFYSELLDIEPALNVPGMTEFNLSENTILGLMPNKSIEKLFDNKYETVEKSSGKIKAELYLIVDEIEKYLERAKKLGADIVSYPRERSWGHKAAYLLDPDNNVIGIAEITDNLKS